MSCQEDQSEDAAHAFKGTDAQVFDIQALLQVEAIAVFDESAQAPIGINLLGDRDTAEGDVGEQGEDEGCLPPPQPTGSDGYPADGCGRSPS